MKRLCLPLLAVSSALLSVAPLHALSLFTNGFARAEYENAASSDFTFDSYTSSVFDGPHTVEQSIAFDGGRASARTTSLLQPGVISFRMTGETEITRPTGDTRAQVAAFVGVGYQDRIGFYSSSQPFGELLSLHLSVIATGARQASVEPLPRPGNDPPGGHPDLSPDGVGYYYVSTANSLRLGVGSGSSTYVGLTHEDSLDRYSEQHRDFSTGRALELDVVVANDPNALYELEIRGGGRAAVGSERLSGATTPAFSRYDVSYSGGLAWEGVTSAFAGDTALSDLYVFSESGIDYNRSYAPVIQPVPEPSTYAAFAALGLVALAARRLRPRKSLPPTRRHQSSVET
jgi:hypothetical protein